MCHVRPKALGNSTGSFDTCEILRTLLNRNLEHDALKFMRVAEFPPSNEDEKELAIRMYLKCGLWQEALYRQREYVRSSSKKEEIRSTLVPLILEHVYVNRALPQSDKFKMMRIKWMRMMRWYGIRARSARISIMSFAGITPSLISSHLFNSNTTTGTTLQCLGSTLNEKERS